MLSGILLALLLLQPDVIAGPLPGGGRSDLIKKIAIIHSYIPGEWYHGLNRGFQEKLGKLGPEFDLTPIVYDSEYWLKRPLIEREKERDRIIAQLKTLKTDLVVVCDDEAS